MWHLDLPTTKSAKDTFKLCISRVRNPILRTRLEKIENEIADASDEFETKARPRIPTTYTIARSDNVAGIVTMGEMVDVYDFRMAKKGAPGRPVYDEIIMSPPHARCPLCGQRTVSTLDHYLPKTEYPTLAVAPANLIPSCQDCNKIKLADFPNASEEEPLHPYFDDITNDLWLHAEVLHTQPAVLRFFVKPPTAWDITTSRRVKTHFDTLQLATLYASHAATELINVRQSLVKLFDGGGAAAVQMHLTDAANSRSAALTNSWQTAAYRALSSDTWYCNGGFN